MIDIETCRRIIIEVTALVGLHVLAFVYDAEYVPAAIGVDAFLLGVVANGQRAKSKNAVEKGAPAN